MINIGFAVLFGVSLLVLLVALAFIAVYISKQNKSSFEFLKESLGLIQSQLHENRKQENDKVKIKIKLQAYERMVLFLERIKPTNLVTRVMLPGQNAGQLQLALQNNIREEYEHNMSQQLYVSNATWDSVKTAKEDVVRLIITSSTKVKPDDTASALAQEVLTAGFESQTNPIDRALNAVKKELENTFN